MGVRYFIHPYISMESDALPFFVLFVFFVVSCFVEVLKKIHKPLLVMQIKQARHQRL